jgi:hypothetical protein
MAVVIHEFEAVAEPRQEKKGESAAEGAPKKIEPAQLLSPLRRIAARHARLKAH